MVETRRSSSGSKRSLSSSPSSNAKRSKVFFLIPLACVPMWFPFAIHDISIGSWSVILQNLGFRRFVVNKSAVCWNSGSGQRSWEWISRNGDTTFWSARYRVAQGCRRSWCDACWEISRYARRRRGFGVAAAYWYEIGLLLFVFGAWSWFSCGFPVA